jgi:FixJ family two-component response regulator
MAVVKVVAGGEAARDELWECYGRLTPREREVMELVTKGMATKEIARDLGLSPRTVEKHRTHINYKMGTDRLADLVRMAVQIEADARWPARLRAARSR